ncbi:MAG TPA: hypothetical protein PLH39_04300 [Promineifilum sp.]|nr:hypothetical protein [Promineifilum sp.]
MPFPLRYIEQRDAQWGVKGTGAEARIVAGEQQVFYVEPAHANANDDNEGTDPLFPLATLTEIITRTAFWPQLAAGDVIYVKGTVSEAVTVPVTAPIGCSIVGVTNGSYVPRWSTPVNTGTCLTLNQLAWRVSGIKFDIPAHGQAITLNWDATNNGSEAIIDNCYFMGGYAGHYGITAVGAPYAVHVLNCEFAEILDGAQTGFAIYFGLTPIADPLMWRIEGNLFWDVDNAIGSLNHDHGLNTSVIKDNLFYDGEGIPTVLKLDLRGGSLGHNIVVGNYFAGDYSNVGGYYDSGAQASEWVGNWTPDIAEAEVADNGLTILPPA